MKKLKIEKIKLSDMSIDDKKNIYGGNNDPAQDADSATIAVTVVTTVTGRTMDTWQGCYTETCLTKFPGHQDSCGLCTTNHAC